MARPLIALDADGVLLDFHLGYAGAWARAFGSAPGRARPARLLADRPLAGRAARRGAARPLPAPLRRAVLVVGAGHRRRRSTPASASTTPATTSSASRRSTPSTRRRGCATCATTAFRSSASSPPATRRASAARRPTPSPRSRPEAFVDDYLPYLRGIPGHVHTALVLRAPNGSPNEGDELALAKSVHDDLAGFADFWLKR